MGVYGTADSITTNQKVAGSSPAERATKIPRFAGKTRIYSKGLGVTPALLAATWQQWAKGAVLPAYRKHDLFQVWEGAKASRSLRGSQINLVRQTAPPSFGLALKY